MNLLEQLAHLRRRIKSRREAALKSHCAVSLRLANQQKHVLFDSLGKNPQGRCWIVRHVRGKCLAGHEIFELPALISELEHGWEASWEMVVEEEVVKLADGFDAGWEAAVD